MSLSWRERNQKREQVSPQGIALVGFTGFCLAWLLASLIPLGEWAPIVFLTFVGLPMAAVSIVVNQSYSWSTTGLRPQAGPPDLIRVAIKTIGFVFTLVSIAFIYWLVPEYHRPYYSPVWKAALWLAIPISIAVVPYIAWVDRRMVEPRDGYWHTGLLLIGRFRFVDWGHLKEHVLGWLVKGFFLPFMVAGVAHHLLVFVPQGIQFDTFPLLFFSVFTAILTLDVVFGAIGYLLTLRILDAHIRSTEKTFAGWASALICYAPFAAYWSAVFGYKGPTDWRDWLQSSPVLYITWGFVIILLHVIYVWSTCSFGCRFSNLTNRGIITDGPYRYLKHPAYFSKNLAWWLMSVPFISHATWHEKLWACFCLALINSVYVLRAWTEERHLAKDPDYVAYAAWMAEHGLLARVARIFWKTTRRRECPV